MDTILIEKVKMHVQDLFEKKHDKRTAYHSLEHTKEVVEAAEKIGKAVELNEHELESVIIAAWFHDTGYLVNHTDHETLSAQFAEEFLSSQQYPISRIHQVRENIMATRCNHTPANLMEEVIHDADYINLANADNLRQSELLRNEIENYGGSRPTEEDWLMSELKFLLNHRYYTEYSKLKLEPKKAENIKKIKDKLKHFQKEVVHTETSQMKDTKTENDHSTNTAMKSLFNWKENQVAEYSENEKVKSSKKNRSDNDKQKQKDTKVSAAVKEFDTIYRLIATNHMRMNAIADRKANIMLSLNAIIISLSMGIVASTSEYTLRYIIPMSILILVCLATIIFAALSTRPMVTTGNVENQAIKEKKANLLFFGNFSKMEFEDFDWGLRQMMADQEYLHNSMILDFYNLGKVLDVKYNYLRICYNVFMFGIILTVLSIPTMILLGF